MCSREIAAVHKTSCVLSAGKCQQVQLLPESNSAGQQHLACKLLHSIKQAAFVFFYRVQEGGGKGSTLTPGTLEWTVVSEHKLGEEKSMVWTLPGKQRGLLLSSAAVCSKTHRTKHSAHCQYALLLLLPHTPQGKVSPWFGHCQMSLVCFIR